MATTGRVTSIALILACLIFNASAQDKFVPNYDESKVPAYTLPDPLTFANGKKVRTAKDWTSGRREEILELFREHVFGKAPGKPQNMRFVVRSVDRKALNGTATRKEVSVVFACTEDGPS